MRVLYRLRQFWRFVTLKTDSQEYVLAQAALNLAQRALFERMMLADRVHSINTYNRLVDQGVDQPDLLVAALLHDVGKLEYPMKPLERVLVVIVRKLAPKKAIDWGSVPSSGWGRLPGWQKAFIVTQQHASWGADMVRQAGVSPLAESLIRLHHHPETQELNNADKALLHKLWAADNET